MWVKPITAKNEKINSQKYNLGKWLCKQTDYCLR
jgi:hypothetical protein